MTENAHDAENEKDPVLGAFLRKALGGEKVEEPPMSFTQFLDENPEIRKKLNQKTEAIESRRNALMFDMRGKEASVAEFSELYKIAPGIERLWVSQLVDLISYVVPSGVTELKGPSDSELSFSTDTFAVWENRMESDAETRGVGERYRRVRSYVGQFFGYRAHALFELEKNVTDCTDYLKRRNDVFGGTPLPEVMEQFAAKYQVTAAEATAYIDEFFSAQLNDQNSDFFSFSSQPWFSRNGPWTDRWADDVFNRGKPWDSAVSSSGELRARIVDMGPVERFDDLLQSFNTEFDVNHGC